MEIIGIICEYNPLHLGHARQLTRLRQENPDRGLVCLMSGNYVQRGRPALFDKAIRARAALAAGADLVLELPITDVLRSAEGFADGGVRILSGFCNGLSFGAENADREALCALAGTLLSPDFPPRLREALARGISFPAARQQALEAMGADARLLQTPNNILAVEYCKAVLRRGSAMALLPMARGGDYHAAEADPENPSATAVRRLIRAGGDWRPFVPPAAVPLYAGAPLHTMEAGERAVLALVRTLPEEAFEALPDGSEGLWRKLMAACRREAGVEAIAASVKSKRYTRTRLDRMLLCAVLGISRDTLAAPAPYTRVLAMNDRGREILKKARTGGAFPHTGDRTEGAHAALERRCDDLYGLFAAAEPEPTGQSRKRRLYYAPGDAHL